LSLLRLKSVFQEQAKLKGEDYFDNIPKHMGDSKFEDTLNIDFDTFPILRLLGRQPEGGFNSAGKGSQFVTDDLLIRKYENETFGSNNYKGSRFSPLSEIPDDFSPSGNISLKGWEELYRAGHKPKNIENPNPDNPFQPYIYGGNVSRDNLDIRSNEGNSGIFTLSRTSLISSALKLTAQLGDAVSTLFGGSGIDTPEIGEPYIVSRIPKGPNDLRSGRTIQMGNRSVPQIRAVTDTVRLAKYLTSPSGIAQSLIKNANTLIPNTVIRDGNELKRVPQRYNVGYNPLSTLVSASPIGRLLGMSNPNILVKKDEGLGLGGITDIFAPDEYGVGTDGVDFSINDTFTSGIEDSGETGLKAIGKQIFTDLVDSFTGKPTKTSYGDKVTLAPMIQGFTLDTSTANQTQGTDEAGTGAFDGNKEASTISVNVESEKEGMPLYFKDLRDNTYVFFRAFIDGITENVAPSWSATNYVGRSEPVYVYERAERDMAFNLNLFAHTRTELSMIYKKLNKLTSMCYPEYAIDELLTRGVNRTGFQKIKQKPPLLKMRLGELYGTANGEVTGFLKSVAYTVPESSTWETERGARVPKQIQCAISYQILHDSTPNLHTSFYGYLGD